MNSYRIDAESDEFHVVVVEAVAPRRRDWWRVLRGTYTPTLARRERLTVKGMDRVIRGVWSEAALTRDLDDSILHRRILERWGDG